MDHVGHAADKIDRIEHINGLRTVGHGDGDAVARAHADGAQRLGALFDVFNQSRVVRRAAHKVKGHMVGETVGNVFDRFKHGSPEVIQVCRNIAEVSVPRRFGGYFLIFHF